MSENEKRKPRPSTIDEAAAFARFEAKLGTFVFQQATAVAYLWEVTAPELRKQGLAGERDADLLCAATGGEATYRAAKELLAARKRLDEVLAGTGV